MSFRVNPLNDDLAILKNANAIARSIRNIVFTERGEKFFNPKFGSRISKLLFDNVDEVVASAIKDEIEFTIKRFEPRVDLTEVTVVPNFDSNEMNATIVYDIIGIDIPPQQLDFVLLPTR